jgi:high-affinity Fe2+/Pb2+ permease
METITVASTRGSMLSNTEILVGAIIIAVVAWMVVYGLKHFRNRHHHEPRV